MLDAAFSPEPLANAECPPPAQSFEELGVPRWLIVDIALRYAREHGVVTLSEIRRALKLSYPVSLALFDHLRQQQFVEVQLASVGEYHFRLTSAAREFAAERSEVCRYAGAVPVPLEQYSAVVRAQRRNVLPTPEGLAEVFSDLVLSADVLDRIGQALASSRPLFLYGPTGNGKTSIIERIPRLYEQTILVPYAVEVDTQIIAVFDPLVHRTVEDSPSSEVDRRWARCIPPCVMAGGELTESMLNLSRDGRTGVYAAPLQMKAQNGLLLIDDFGRQVISPRQLFNRWILPLDRRIDFLCLEYGLSFQVPFETLLVFATNMPPAEIADDAFLRRVPNKIPVMAPDASRFDEILRRALRRRDLVYDPAWATGLRDLCRKRGVRELGACLPNDLIEIISARAAFRRSGPTLSLDALSEAVEVYFADARG